MGKKYKVEGRVILYVDTWFEDDEKTDLHDQASEQLWDLASSMENAAVFEGDEVFIGEAEVTSVLAHEEN
jgi:hypothetical protein